jgi:uroporphyrinogen-III decarboxylase
LIPEIKKFGTKVFVDSDGNIELMLDWLIDAGEDGILPLERQSGIDLVKLRKRYPNFMFIGGFDKMCLFKGKEAIRQEVERLLPVIRSGRYIIGMDHQTPPGTTLENYRYYLSVLREVSVQACKDC